MQNSTTILGIIEMRLKGISYDDCRNRYGVGNSTVNLIMSRYRAKGIPLEVLKQMPGSEVEASFYPPSNVRRKSEDIMPDYEAIYNRINQDGSKGEYRKKYFDFLEKLRESGEANMYGAVSNLQDAFPELRYNRKRAEDIHLAWIASFDQKGETDEC